MHPLPRPLTAAQAEKTAAQAEKTAARGAKRFLIVTSAAADADSPLFYLRLKGRLEEELQTLGFQRLDIFRPSFMLSTNGVRNALNMLLWGPLRQYRAVSPLAVAEAMTAGAAEPEPGVRIHCFGFPGPA